jgi:two-component system, NarL family, nitrate/nitrite response regulator NarL
MSMGKKTGVVNILIADEDRRLRTGLRKLLEAEPGLNVVGEAGDGKETARLVRQLRPNILMLDFGLPRRTGFDVLRELGKSSTPVRTIVLAPSMEDSEVLQAIQLGARAVVLKPLASETLIECVRNVMAGRYWVGGEQSTDLVQILRSLVPSAVGAERRTFGLTPRELEVIATVIAGYSNKDIAKKFRITEETVQHHLRNIFNKLDVSSRFELVLFAIAHRLASTAL